MANETADDASLALAIQMQMQEGENPYVNEYYYEDAGDNVDDSDYDGEGGKKSKRKKKQAKGPAAKRTAKSAAEATAEANANDENTPAADPNAAAASAEAPTTGMEEDKSASGRRRRKDAGKERQKARAWTDEEERLFVEALELYGRDWKKCAEHVGTRDAKSFTSHAQKYFIKQCLAGNKLPAKVEETGKGFTLSGKLLDPFSAAARAYGFKPEHLHQIKGTKAEGGVAMPEDIDSAIAAAAAEAAASGGSKRSSKKQKEAAAAAAAGTPAALPADTGAAAAVGSMLDAAAAAVGSVVPHVAAPDAILQPQPPATLAMEAPAAVEAAAEVPAVPVIAAVDAAAAPGAAEAAPVEAVAEIVEAQQTGEPDAATADHPAAADEPTDYVKNRPRREVKKRAAYGHTTESLDLQKCMDFVGPPGSGAPLAQPFKVAVEAEALLLMDLHSHLSSCEVIGLLGGKWDAETRSISVVRAFPCKRAVGSDSSTSVELDPGAEVATRALMEQQQLVPVGWYHSHPIFEPRPSAKDSENQRNYQALFQDAASGTEPFVGAIVGPYDAQLPSEASAVRWFVVQHKNGDLIPYNVAVSKGPPGALPTPESEAAMMEVIDMFKEDIGRIDFTEPWRTFRIFQDGVPTGGPCSKLDKLRSALLHHLPGAEDAKTGLDALLERICRHIQSSWNLPLGYE